MLYATWTIDRSDGSTPEPTIRSAGGTASGGLMLNDDLVLGYVAGNVDLKDLQKWNFQLIKQDYALVLAKAKNPKSYITEAGTIQAEREDVK